MPVETPSLFAQVIREHLDLKERNSQLDDAMPIGRYLGDDPFNNHPLFKTEEQARIEETMDGVQPEFTDESLEQALAWPAADQSEAPTAESAAPAARKSLPSGAPAARATSTGARVLSEERFAFARAETELRAVESAVSTALRAVLVFDALRRGACLVRERARLRRRRPRGSPSG